MWWGLKLVGAKKLARHALALVNPLAQFKAAYCYYCCPCVGGKDGRAAGAPGGGGGGGGGALDTIATLTADICTDGTRLDGL